MDLALPRYPLATWVTGTLVTLALAVVVRAGAALADLDVLVPSRDGGGPEPLTFAELVGVTITVFAAAVVVVVVADRLLHGRARRVVRVVAIGVLIASVVAVVASEVPTESVAVLVVLHLLVGGGVLRTVVRE